MRSANGTGHITKLAGNRRRPYAVRKIVGWTEKGTPKYKYISYHKTHREAVQALNKYNDDPYILTSRTVSEVYKEWLPQQKRADGTIKAYETAFKKMKPLHDVKMSQIDRLMLQQFYDNMDGTKNTSGNVRKLMQNLIKYSVKRGIMPMSALMLHKTVDFSERDEGKTTKHKRIPIDVVNKLWEIKDNETVRQILLYIYTGCRYAELYDLEPENCHPDRIDIVDAKTEAGIRTVPLSDKVLSLLPVKPIPSYDVFNKRFKEVLPNYHIHDTRYTFISMMTEAGVDNRIIKVIVGHKSNDITEHYTKIKFESLLEAINKI